MKTWEPVPYLWPAGIARRRPYPTRPVAVTIEILSPGDPFTRVIRTPVGMLNGGIPDVLVFDPIGREAWFWDIATGDLARVQHPYAFKSKSVQLILADVFARLDAEL